MTQRRLGEGTVANGWIQRVLCSMVAWSCQWSLLCLSLALHGAWWQWDLEWPGRRAADVELLAVDTVLLPPFDCSSLSGTGRARRLVAGGWDKETTSTRQEAGVASGDERDYKRLIWAIGLCMVWMAYMWYWWASVIGLFLGCMWDRRCMIFFYSIFIFGPSGRPAGWKLGLTRHFLWVKKDGLCLPVVSTWLAWVRSDRVGQVGWPMIGSTVFKYAY